MAPSLAIANKPQDRLGIVFLAIALLCAGRGCEKPLSRPAPSAAEFRARYLTHFSQSQIEKVDYVYEGAIGGECTLGRIEFKKDGSIEIKKGTAEMGTYDPTKLTEPERREFKERWSSCAGGKIPPWFDFPFSRRMRTIRDVQGESGDSASHERTWYIDEERKVVYFLAIEG